MGASTDALLSGEAIARTAAELIAIPSLGGEEDEVLAVVTRWLTDHGVAVEQRDLPGRAVAIHPFHSAEVHRERIPVLIARVGPAEPTRRLLVNVHVDVVPGAEQDGWTTGPFDPVIRDGLLYGRGSADTKGGLAAAMHVLAALALEPSSLTGEVVLTPVVGEEDGGAGTLASLIAGVRADGAIVVEPTDLAIAPASAGALCFAVTVEGRTAHGSVRHTGVSAIEKAWLVHRRILDLEAERAGRPNAALPLMLEALDLWGGDLAEDLDLEFLELERIHLRSRFVRASCRAAELLVASRRPNEAIAVARPALYVDRWNERSYLALADAYVAIGDHTSARAVLDRGEAAIGMPLDQSRTPRLAT